MLTTAELNAKFFPKDVARTQICNGLIVVTDLRDDGKYRTATRTAHGADQELGGPYDSLQGAQIGHQVCVNILRNK